MLKDDDDINEHSLESPNLSQGINDKVNHGNVDLNSQSLPFKERLNETPIIFKPLDDNFKFSKDFNPPIDMGLSNTSEAFLGQGWKKGGLKNNKKVSIISRPKMISVDERPNPGKRPRLDFDPNGLDALLGLEKAAGNNSVGEQANTVVDYDTLMDEDKEQSIGEEGDKRFDLNSQPEKSAESKTNDLDGKQSDSPDEEIQSEVQATVLMGEKLGAKLVNFEELVRKTVENEGIQKGNS